MDNDSYLPTLANLTYLPTCSNLTIVFKLNYYLFFIFKRSKHYKINKII